MLKHDIGLDSIRSMSDQDVMEYVMILKAFDDIEHEQMESKQ
jgi:hypothetical protein